jgi:hypothetical protein
MGAQISVVTKSGTSEFHGSGYWFHRHDGLNANNWFNNRDKLPRKLFRFNDQGGTLGGPLPIPRLSRGRDKTNEVNIGVSNNNIPIAYTTDDFSADEIRSEPAGVVSERGAARLPAEPHLRRQQDRQLGRREHREQRRRAVHQLQHHHRHHRQRVEGLEPAHVQGRDLHAEEPQEPDLVRRVRRRRPGPTPRSRRTPKRPAPFRGTRRPWRPAPGRRRRHRARKPPECGSICAAPSTDRG